MAQFEYQVVEQAGGRASHLNERIMQLVHEGWTPTMMTGVSPQVSVMMQRPAQPKTQPVAAQAAPQAAPAPAPRPAQPLAPPAPRPPQPQ